MKRIVPFYIFSLSILLPQHDLTLHQRSLDCSYCCENLKVEVESINHKKAILFLCIEPEASELFRINNRDSTIRYDSSLTKIKFYKQLEVFYSELEYGNNGYCAKQKDIIHLTKGKICSVRLLTKLKPTYGAVSICK
jgi:hypothetical protein